MSYFFKVDDQSGFDAGRYLQVISVRQTTTIYAYDVPGTSSIHTDDPTVAVVVSVNDMSAAEMKAKNLGGAASSGMLRKIIVRGEGPGTATLMADPAPPGDIKIRISVVNAADRRQADGPVVSGDFRSELTAMNLKSAAIRVAEDQVFSSLAKSGGGDGLYGVAAGTEWCGAWAFWCYKTAAAIKSRVNPLGTNNDIFLSPQKAISWGISSPLATVLRYKGPAPMDFRFKQGVFIDVDGSHPIAPGDLCLLRDDANWRHVCMVYQAPSGNSFYTIDGNQGVPSMKIVNRQLGEKLPSGTYKHSFVTLQLPY